MEEYLKYQDSSSISLFQGTEYIAKVKEDIKKCADDIALISANSAKIKAQGGWDRFWKKSGNITILADNSATLATVQQRTLSLLILLMGATGRMKEGYNIITESIEELGKSHSGSVEVLDYLVKLKNTIAEMKRRDEQLESLISSTKDLPSTISSIKNSNKRLRIYCLTIALALVISLIVIAIRIL